MRSSEVAIRGKDYMLRGTLVLPNQTGEKLQAVIFYHGMVSKRKPRYVRRAKALAKEGIVGLVFDFRGCGESKGELQKLTLADWLTDALIAFDYLTQLPFVDSKRIGMSGKSFGGYMGALVTSKRNVRSMVLQAPAVYKDSWFAKMPSVATGAFKEQRLAYRNSKDALANRAIQAMKQYRGSLLVIGSELDNICPKHVVEGFYNASPSKNRKIAWIKGADHQLSKEKWNKPYTDMMSDWFKETL